LDVPGLDRLVDSVETARRLQRQYEGVMIDLAALLTGRAEAFRAADAAGEPVAAPSLPAVTRCSSLSLGPPPRYSEPGWLTRAAGTFKLVAGGFGIAGGIALMGMATGGVGLLLVPVGIIAILHSGGDAVEGLTEALTGKDAPNAIQMTYEGLWGEKTGDTIYHDVDWGLTIVSVGAAGKGAVKGASKVLAAEGAEAAQILKAEAKGLASSARDLGLDLGNKVDVTRKVYHAMTDDEESQ
jgi:hypothetical protein